MKIRNKVLLVLLTVVFISGVAIATISKIVSENTVKEEIKNSLEGLAHSRTNNIKTLLDNEEKLTLQLSESVVIERLLVSNKADANYEGRLNDVIMRLKNSANINKEIHEVFVLDTKGVVIASSIDETIGLNRSHDPYFVDVINGETGSYIKGPYLSKFAKGQHSLAISAPILEHANNTLIGVVVIRIRLNSLNNIMTDRTGLGETGETYLINRDGYMITPSRFMDDTFLKQKVDTPESRECCELSGEEEEERKEIDIYETYDGKMVLGDHHRIDETGWCLLAEMGEKEILAPVTALTHAILFILGVVLLVCMMLAILISRRITKPILTLHEAADQIIKGNLDHKAGTEAKDEIGDLSRAFDSMTAELKESRKKLEDYSKGLEEKVKERTKELNEKAKESEEQKKAAINLLENVKEAKEGLEKRTTELAEANKSLEAEITERKQAEEKFQESEEKFRVVADSAQDAMIVIDNNGNVLFWNASAEKNFGYAYSEIVGQNFHELLIPKRLHQKHKKAFTVFQETGKGPAIGKTVELPAVRKSGEEFPVELSLSAIKLKGKWHSVGIVRDITERKQAEEELKKTNQELVQAVELANQMTAQAETANIAKSEFLANMSHEIRTPMNAVIGFTDMLLDSDLDNNQIDYTETIRSSGNALLSVINDVLDFSKIEAGEMDFEEIDFDPKLLAYDVCELTHPRIGTKPVEILCRIGDRLPSYVKGDPARFRQVLINLMGNSSKFTESGEIELSLDIEEEKDDQVKLHAAIRDTGIGIPKDKLSAIFSPFQQADGSTTRQYGGTGLGLSICKKISKLMGGDVWAESQSTGSVFHFTAWFKKAEDKEVRRFTSVSLTGRKALIVDDNQTNLDILTHLLESVGMRVVALGNGADVVPTLTNAFESGDPFDSCILDIQMPGMSGYEVVKQIRNPQSTIQDFQSTINNHQSSIQSLPLLALSSLMERDAKKCGEAGFDGFLSKPIRREKLYRMLERMIGKRKVEGKKDEAVKEKIITQYSVREEMKRSARILLAEDNPVNQKLAKMMLTKAGYQVEVADNGKEAVEKYAASPENFDLIFMDVQMPEMDGLEATREIRKQSTINNQQSSIKRVPIVAMTAHAMKGDREKCIEAGMDDYITKPIKREIVFGILEKWVFG